MFSIQPIQRNTQKYHVHVSKIPAEHENEKNEHEANVNLKDTRVVRGGGTKFEPSTTNEDFVVDESESFDPV